MSLLPQLHPSRTLLTLRQLIPSFSLFASLLRISPPVNLVKLVSLLPQEECNWSTPLFAFKALGGGVCGLNWLILFPPEPCTAQSYPSACCPPPNFSEGALLKSSVFYGEELS